MAQITQWMGNDPTELRHYLQEGRDRGLTLRRGIVAASLIGTAAMGITTLLQMGMVRRLPEPHWGNFDTKKVNSTDEAYSYGGPDASISIKGHGFNLMLATTGGPDRAARHPWLPLLAAVMSGAQAFKAGMYLFYRMPKVDRAWCPYCIVDALAHFATFALTLPEAAEAGRRFGTKR